MNIVQCLSHAIEEYDQLRLLSGLGHDVFSIGGYIDPASPHDPKRPALPDVRYHPDLHAAVDALGTSDNLGAAQAYIPDAILDWADVIIFHHKLERLWGQWWRLRGKRVIWRTVGQSVEGNERDAAPFRAQGLQIVRYSPKERNIPGFAGEDALIRFYKDPDEWTGWTGENPVVLNIAQHDATPHARDEWLNWGFWEVATQGLPTILAGPHSEKVGGLGMVSEDEMKRLLRTSRAFLYTGTQPASYTLGLIEAMMTGIPIVSIGPEYMRIFPYGRDLFEGHDLAVNWADDPGTCRAELNHYLVSPEAAQRDSEMIRQRAIDLFGKATIAAQWAAFLDGVPAETALVGSTA